MDQISAADGVRETVRSLIRHTPAPDVWPRLCRLGAVAFALPSWASGFDLGQSVAIVIAEELGRDGVRTPYLGTIFAVECLAALGDEGRRADVMRDVADAERVLTAVAPSGPSARGLRVRTTERNGLVLGGAADLLSPHEGAADLLLTAHADDGPVLALLPAVRVRRGADSGTVALDGVPLTRNDVLAEAPRSRSVLAAAMARAQVRQAAYLVGVATGAVDEARRHTTARRQFGQALATFQSVRFRLAALMARLAAVRLLVEYTARCQDSGDHGELAAVETLAAAADLALEAGREAVHLHGARGLVAAAPVSGFYLTAASEAARFGAPRELWHRVAVLRRSRRPVHSENERSRGR
jgi:alkylation response protein AidB-like acyl-CoA dehydrogenase